MGRGFHVVAGKPISRILFLPQAGFGNHLSGALHPMASRQAAHTILHELAPREVYHASSVTLRAVSSYLTFSPLPPTQSVGKYQYFKFQNPNKLQCLNIQTLRFVFHLILVIWNFTSVPRWRRFIFCCTFYPDQVALIEPQLRPKDR